MADERVYYPLNAEPGDFPLGKDDIVFVEGGKGDYWTIVDLLGFPFEGYCEAVQGEKSEWFDLTTLNRAFSI